MAVHDMAWNADAAVLPTLTHWPGGSHELLCRQGDGPTCCGRSRRRSHDAAAEGYARHRPELQYGTRAQCSCRDDKRHVAAEVTRAQACRVLAAICGLEEGPTPPWTGQHAATGITAAGQTLSYCESLECCRGTLAKAHYDWEHSEVAGNCKGLISAADRAYHHLHPVWR